VHPTLRRAILGPTAVLTLLALGAGCGTDGPPSEHVPLGTIVADATDAERAAFARGRVVALRRFTEDDGHGPPFNVASCAACHEKPVLGGGAGRYRNFLLVGRTSAAGFFATAVNGVQPQFTRAPATRVASDPLTEVTATRNPIPFFGVGLLAALPDEEILLREDPDDADGDGISGRANRDQGRVGRFGRKAQTVSIEGFVRGPLFNHLGITTDPLSPARRRALPVADIERSAPARLAVLLTWMTPAAWAQVAAQDRPTRDDDGVPDPELDEQDLFDLVAFTMLLAAPAPEPPTPATAAGRVHFETIGCAACHVPALDGPRGPVGAFSDLLLHDLGPELADGIVMGRAQGTEFRTQPLWGIAAVGPFLHDGRASTVDEAIRLHGGEAAPSRDRYQALRPAARGQLLAFLDSLGGREQHTDGLLPPTALLPEPGTPGGPTVALDDAARARFMRGRTLFDRDLTPAAGLGPVFNGDACRACHFDPVLGGAGPIDVNVMRHGATGAGGRFVPPAIGTIAHRHAVAPDVRAEDASAAAATVFEMRQTPPLFGLGLVERIPAATILAHEDPDDTDGDGIRGRAHRLADGRLGRFGWQAQIPTLGDFARDAFASELGATVPHDATSAFGGLGDDDDVPDPEVRSADVADLVFFMEQLGPLPRRPAAAAVERDGARLFAELGCAACHVPQLATADGTPVALYSDLLLHDVRPPADAGIAEGGAGVRDLRTPPLWGLGHTAPYMHDGRTATVRGAILRHAGEAEDARDRFGALDAEAQALLLAFLRSL
jgi:CxxC motif-containing protein (DUF1111 family)